MELTRISPHTGKENTMNLDVTSKQLFDWNNGMLIQDAMPNLTREEREFLISGHTPKDWKEAFGSQEEYL